MVWWLETVFLVDFEFFGFDLSYEINNDYLLFKKLEETRNDMNAIINSF